MTDDNLRAIWASESVRHHFMEVNGRSLGDDDDEFKEAVVDLVTNLMHCCGNQWDAILEMAEIHYQHELDREAE